MCGVLLSGGEPVTEIGQVPFLFSRECWIALVNYSRHSLAN